MKNSEMNGAVVSVDLHDLEIETFEVETLADLGIVAAAAVELPDVTIASTSSTTSSSCCG